MSLVVGIDIGNENCVVSAINKNGVADVVLNEASNRETPLLIHFDKKQRFFGSAGASYASRNPKATFTQIKRLIGRRFDEPSFQNERHLLPYDTFPGPNGEIIVRVEFAGNQWMFTAVELLGMFLCHLSKSVQKLTGSQISECVLGVPSYLTIQQRKDYLLSAEIAGLKPRRLFHDGAATALEYALSRDLPYGEAIHVVFVDIGHCDTQVAVVKFCFGTLTVLAHSFDRDLGGRNFDDKIFEHLVRVIHEKHSIHVTDHVKASFRLRTACAKAKTVLSVNTEASVSIECLMNDIDVDETISRATFEKMSSDLLNGIVNACKKALEDAGLGNKEIRSIELVGSGSRIPMISQVLEDFFGQKMSRTVNGSECIANGCTLQCAMLCQMPPITRTFGVLDIFPFSLAYKLDKHSSIRPSKIFDKGRFFLDIESLTLPLSFLNVILEYADPMELTCDVSKYITHYKISYIDGDRKGYLEVRFQINIHGILHVLSASLVNELLNEYEYSVDLVKMESYEDGEGNGRIKEEGSSPAVVTNDLLVEVVAVEGHSRGTQVGRFFEVLSHTGCGVVEKALGKENELEFHDKSNERAKNLRNGLEAYLIHLRSAVSTKSFRFASETHTNTMLTMLQDTERWLYGPGADETEQAYSEEQHKLYLAIENLHSKHTIAEQRAGEKRDELCAYALEIRQLYTRRHNLKEGERNALKSKLHDIDFMMKEHGLRFQEEYSKEIEELKLIHGNITNRLKVEDAEKSKTTSGVWSTLSRFLPGANQEHSNNNSQAGMDSMSEPVAVNPTDGVPNSNNQAGMDSMSEPVAVNPTDGVPNRDDQVGSVPVDIPVPIRTDETELKNEPQALNSETLTSYPEIRDENRILHQPQSGTAQESNLFESNEQKNSNDANMVTQQSTRPIGDQNTCNDGNVNSNKGNTLENISASSEHDITQGACNISTRQTDLREAHGVSSSQNKKKKKLFELTLIGKLGILNVTYNEDSLIGGLKNVVLQAKGGRPDYIMNHSRQIYPDHYTIKSFRFKKGHQLYYEFVSV